MRSTGGAAMSERWLVNPLAKARYLNYLIEHLNMRLLEEHGRGGKPEDEIKRAYWAQTITSLYRGLEHHERQARGRH
jgi:hypothetical protein